ncbi:MAG: CAP domain-containing protein [Polyangiales bacterium]
MTRRPRRSRWCLAWLALAGSCASPRRPTPQPRVDAPTPRPNEVVAADPSAAALVAEIVGVARGEGVALTADPDLDETARGLLARVQAAPGHRTPAAPVIQALAWRAGLRDPIPAVVVMRRSPGAWSDESRRGLSTLLRGDGFTHLGAAVTRVDGDELVVLALTQRRVQLSNVPRSARMGERLTLRGALQGAVRAPVLMLTRPDGSTRETALGEGPSFDTTVPLDARGAWQVELMAQSPQGATVVANFPVYVDVDAPPVPADVTVATSTEPAAVAQELLALLAQSRSRAGLPTLLRMPVLDRVAQAHSDDMAAHRFVAHVSPTTGAHDDRLRAAGFLAGLSLENVARGYSAAEIHEGLLASPGHRANLLHATVTHVGVGVAREPDGPGLLVTQVFVEVPRALDAEAEATRLFDALNARRASRGLAALARHPALQGAAAEAARGFFRRPEVDQQALFQAAARSAQREGGAFRRVSVAGAFGPRAAGAEEAPSLLEPDLRAVGVGVAQGDRTGQPPGSVLVVFVTAVPR